MYSLGDERTAYSLELRIILPSDFPGNIILYLLLLFLDLIDSFLLLLLFLDLIDSFIFEKFTLLGLYINSRALSYYDRSGEFEPPEYGF